jgi:hypothetical protein
MRKIAMPFFMEIVMLVSWAIKTTRNGYIFKGMHCNLIHTQEKIEGGD